MCSLIIYWHLDYCNSPFSRLFPPPPLTNRIGIATEYNHFNYHNPISLVHFPFFLAHYAYPILVQRLRAPVRLSFRRFMLLLLLFLPLSFPILVHSDIMRVSNLSYHSFFFFSFASFLSLVRVLKLAKLCRELRNFNTMFCILVGLHQTPVERLKQTWERLPNKYQKLYRDLSVSHTMKHSSDVSARALHRFSLLLFRAANSPS